MQVGIRITKIIICGFLVDFNITYENVRNTQGNYDYNVLEMLYVLNSTSFVLTG